MVYEEMVLQVPLVAEHVRPVSLAFGDIMLGLPQRLEGDDVVIGVSDRHRFLIIWPACQGSMVYFRSTGRF